MSENVNNGLTLNEFDRLWNIANNFIGRVRGWLDHNIVLEVTGSEIMADDYRVDYYDDDTRNGLIIFYYKGYLVAKIELKYIKDVY
jgi:hypothetical protein